MSLIYIAIGGALGAIARALLSMAVAFPFGTLTVNLVGCFVMGIAFVLLADRGSSAQALVMTGLLGGFTTFSAFSLDVIKLVEMGRLAGASAYVAASVLFSLVAIWAGISLMRMFGP